MKNSAMKVRLLGAAAGAMVLAGCDGGPGGFDFDLRGSAGQLDTSAAAQSASGQLPEPDARGVISYPGYQVAVAKRGDTVRTVAERVGLPVDEIARFNALPQDISLRQGEIIALPRRVREPDLNTAASGPFDVSTLAGDAIDRAEGRPGVPTGAEPTRHRVEAGETAFSIARSYNVPVAALAEWNGLGPDLTLRVGQYLLIPTRTAQAAPATIEEAPSVEVAAVAPPGRGSATPVPPSASRPLPAEDARPAAPAPAPEPIATPQTAASDTAKLRMPVQGRIIRTFEKGKNEGISISANAGASVVAADAGTVAAITRDTDQVPILVIRHAGNLLTVYAGVDEIAVQKGDTVGRGDKIAVVRAASPPFLHFEVREGFDSVDPDPYLN